MCGDVAVISGLLVVFGALNLKTKKNLKNGMIIKKLPRAKQKLVREKKGGGALKVRKIFPQHIENWLIFSPFSGFIPDSRRRPKWAEKYVTFNEYLSILAQLFWLSHVKTHFYS